MEYIVSSLCILKMSVGNDYENHTTRQMLKALWDEPEHDCIHFIVPN